MSEPTRGRAVIMQRRFPTLAMGYQTIAVGGRVREHSHGECFLGHDVKHEIVNEGKDELVMLWVITPPGLETPPPSPVPPTSWPSSARSA